MGFLRIKEELLGISEISDCCMIAELSAIIHTAGSLLRRHDGTAIEISSKYDISGFILSALKNLYYTDITQNEVTTSLSDSFVIIIPTQISRSVLTDCGIIGYDKDGSILINSGIDDYVVMDDCCKAAYVRGTFLGCGSFSFKSGYHLEFAASSIEFAEDLKRMIESFDLKCGIMERRGRNIVYLKDGITIADLLTLMGAEKASESFSELLANRSVKGNIVRESNCFQANLDKTFKAAAEQILSIDKLVESGAINSLSETLKETAVIRLQYADESLAELAKRLDVSKSTLNNRLKRLKEIADECELIN